MWTFFHVVWWALEFWTMNSPECGLQLLLEWQFIWRSSHSSEIDTNFFCLNSCFYPSPFQCFDSSMIFFSNRHSFKILLTLFCFCWYISFVRFVFCTLRYWEAGGGREWCIWISDHIWTAKLMCLWTETSGFEIEPCIYWAFIDLGFSFWWWANQTGSLQKKKIELGTKFWVTAIFSCIFCKLHKYQIHWNSNFVKQRRKYVVYLEGIVYPSIYLLANGRHIMPIPQWWELGS